MYSTYRFKDHDPVLDIVRTCIQIYAATGNMKLSAAIKRLARDSGVSETCIWHWWAGYTKCPRFATVVAVVHATGREVFVGNHGMGSKKRFKVIEGGRAA